MLTSIDDNNQQCLYSQHDYWEMYRRMCGYNVNTPTKKGFLSINIAIRLGFQFGPVSEGIKLSSDERVLKPADLEDHFPSFMVGALLIESRSFGIWMNPNLRVKDWHEMNATSKLLHANPLMIHSVPVSATVLKTGSGAELEEKQSAHPEVSRVRSSKHSRITQQRGNKVCFHLLLLESTRRQNFDRWLQQV